MAILSISMALSGCASVSPTDTAQLHASTAVADNIPHWAGGEPSNAPARPDKPQAYPNVFSTQPAHDKKLLTDDERKRAEAELTAARNGTVSFVAATKTAEKQRAAENAALAAAHERMAVQQSGATTSN